MRASQSAGDPHVYSLEVVAEAVAVHALVERGVSHAEMRRAITALAAAGALGVVVAGRRDGPVAENR
jgi:hypothetical protein